MGSFWFTRESPLIQKVVFQPCAALAPSVRSGIEASAVCRSVTLLIGICCFTPERDHTRSRLSEARKTSLKPMWHALHFLCGSLWLCCTLTITRLAMRSAGIIASSVVCPVCFVYQYGLRRSARFSRLSFGNLAFSWVRLSEMLIVVAFSMLPASKAWLLK